MEYICLVAFLVIVILVAALKIMLPETFIILSILDIEEDDYD